MGYFVDRPVFATVIALIISLVGVIAFGQLAIEQYPTVAPPQVKVTAVYPGASPELLENVVAAPLEREMNGVSGLQGRADPVIGPHIDHFPVPAGRSGQPDEIAALIAFLLGADARFFCGSVIFCDGGTDAQARPDDWPAPLARS